MKSSLLSLFFIFSVALTPIRVFAQQGANTLVDQSVQDAIIVGAAGVGGAILGLSTLSFVEEPKNHLKNILVGGAIGIIVGVGIVAYSQATKSESIYKQSAEIDAIDFNTNQRLSWHKKEQSTLVPVPASQLGYQFSF
jgi:apolipoprotein N-acyltransferase